ncbi:hypothetical protein AMAG_12974 [Allomyces macrogynus ATCC 38327]|uniref:Uncharacterized protein n=1 Tax=Allomyces macrogynus (strain ATCC 38327) TaxID=578462 RepID=A0A0L0T0M6_ALLM3|nr:hypothetical protein AMAG_12974 [Allomyces macrogynus ATCC 38327]|eukprot:KNE68307.1 hypothetical protein AMAG_12974 [Allomyces macrogynus ATCC 38327]
MKPSPVSRERVAHLVMLPLRHRPVYASSVLAPRRAHPHQTASNGSTSTSASDESAGHGRHRAEHAQENGFRAWWTRKLVHEWPAAVHTQWTQLGAPTAPAWQQSVHSRGTAVLARLPWEETLAKHLDHPDALVLYHPARVESRSAERQLVGLLRERLVFHQRWRKYTACGLPASVAAGIFPGPNLPLLYNAFRVYSHHVATEHLTATLALLSSKSPPLRCEPIADLDAVAHVTQTWVGHPTGMAPPLSTDWLEQVLPPDVDQKVLITELARAVAQEQHRLSRSPSSGATTHPELGRHRGGRSLHSEPAATVGPAPLSPKSSTGADGSADASTRS